MPAPASAFGIFKAAFDPTPHAGPDRARLCWRYIGDDQPHFLVAFVPARQQCALQATDLPRKTVHFPTPGTAYLWRGCGQTPKLPFPLRAEMPLLVDAHERMPTQRHNLGIQPGSVQA